MMKCKCCGEDISSMGVKPGRNPDYCSKRCMFKYHDTVKKIREYLDREPAVCPICAKEYKAYNEMQVCCSIECLQQHNPKYYQRLKRYEKQGVARGSRALAIYRGEGFSRFELQVLEDELQRRKNPNKVANKVECVIEEYQCRTEPFADMSREDMMALVAKRNSVFDSPFEKMLNMEIDEFRNAFSNLSKENQGKFRSFYIKKFGIKPMSGNRFLINNQRQDGRVKKSLYQRVLEASKSGTLGYIRCGRIRDCDFHMEEE